MIDAGDFQEFVGFTEEEVRALCEQYQVDFDTMQSWYDGYTFPYVPHIYNPKCRHRRSLERDCDSIGHIQPTASGNLGW